MPVYEEIERARTAFEEDLIPEVADLYAAQGDAIIEAIEAAPGAGWAVLHAESIAGDASIALEALSLVWGTVGPSFAVAAYEGLIDAKSAPSQDEWLSLVLEFLEREGVVMVQAITDTLLEELRAVLQEGVRQGESVQELARRVREAWPEITAARAERIVRTEVVSASNHASVAGYERAALDFGLDLVLEWIDTPDARTRASHRAAGGQRVPLGGMFIVGGYEARFPGDPNLPAGERIQCRCAVVAVPADMKAVTVRLDMMNERERGRVELALRDLNIRMAYPDAKARLGQLEAFEHLAESFHCSVSTVKRACGW